MLYLSSTGLHKAAFMQVCKVLGFIFPHSAAIAFTSSHLFSKQFCFHFHVISSHMTLCICNSYDQLARESMVYLSDNVLIRLRVKDSWWRDPGRSQVTGKLSRMITNISCHIQLHPHFCKSYNFTLLYDSIHSYIEKKISLASEF